MQLRGVRPFFSDKYDITQHPNYKYLSDADKKNTFDIGKAHLSPQRPETQACRGVRVAYRTRDPYEDDEASIDDGRRMLL